MNSEPNFEPRSLNPLLEKPTDSDVISRRVERLVDGVFAIVLTLLVLDIKVLEAASDYSVS